MKTRSRVGRKLNSRYINRIDVYREGDAQVVVYPLPWFLTNNKDKELITEVYLLGVLSRPEKTIRVQPRIPAGTRLTACGAPWIIPTSHTLNYHSVVVHLSAYILVFILMRVPPPDGFFTGRIRCNPWYF